MIFNNQEWYDIPGYNGKYQLNKRGQVKSNTVISKGKLLAISETNGYQRVKLNNHYVSLHRLVAKTLIPNPKQLEQVNHIDGNKQNNNVDNLEWISRSDNQLHAYKLGLQKPKRGKENSQSKTIQQFDLNGKLLNEFYSTKEAGKILGFPGSLISSIVNGHRKQKSDYILKHKETNYIIEEIQGEIWKSVNKEGFRDYQISNMGRIIGMDGKLKTIFYKRYPTVRLRNDSFLVHRLVAETFMPNFDETHVVNHKDENKQNFKLENLEWASHSENVKYSIDLKEKRKEL